MVAGLAYAFLPFHVTQAAGHPHVAQTQWLPLYLLALWRCVDRPDLRRAALLLAAAAAVALSNFYGGFIAAVLSPVALVAYGVVSPTPAGREPAATRGDHGPRARGGGRGRPRPHPPLRPRGPAASRVPCLPALGSLRLEREVVELPDSRRWTTRCAGPRVREFWAGRGVGESLLEHQQVGVGWSLLVLGAVPLWLWLRGDRTSLAVRSAPVLASLAVAALLCSLSPERRIGSLHLRAPVRAALRGGADVPGLCAVRRGGRPHDRAAGGSGRRLAVASAHVRRPARGRAPPRPGRPGICALPSLAVARRAPDPRPPMARGAARLAARAGLRAAVPSVRLPGPPAARPRGFAARRADLRRLRRAAARGQAEGDGLHPRRGAAGQHDRKVAGGATRRPRGSHADRSSRTAGSWR